MAKYNSFPLGQLPIELQRPEITQLKEMGYDIKDPRDAISIFEKKVADFSGSKYAVTTDCCSHGIFLSLKYLQNIGELNNDIKIKIPNKTYISTPMQIMNIGNDVIFDDFEWSGVYQLSPTRIYDGAVRWTKDMYVGGDALQVVSFQIKKRIPIGKGGMILTNDYEAYKMLKLMSYDGRDLSLPYDHKDHVKSIGYHMYMTPEDAARGIILMESVSETNDDSGNSTMYPDVEQMLKNIKL